MKRLLWKASYKQPCPVKCTSRSLPWRGLGKFTYPQTYESLSCLMYKLGVLDLESNLPRLRTRKSNNPLSFNSPIVPLPQLLRKHSAFRYGVVSITAQFKTAGRPPLSFHVEVAEFVERPAPRLLTPTQLNYQVQINSEEPNFRVVNVLKCRCQARLCGIFRGYLTSWEKQSLLRVTDSTPRSTILAAVTLARVNMGAISLPSVCDTCGEKFVSLEAIFGSKSWAE